MHTELMLFEIPKLLCQAHGQVLRSCLPTMPIKPMHKYLGLCYIEYLIALQTKCPVRFGSQLQLNKHCLNLVFIPLIAK